MWIRWCRVRSSKVSMTLNHAELESKASADSSDHNDAAPTGVLRFMARLPCTIQPSIHPSIPRASLHPEKLNVCKEWATRETLWQSSFVKRGTHSVDGAFFSWFSYQSEVQQGGGGGSQVDGSATMQTIFLSYPIQGLFQIIVTLGAGGFSMLSRKETGLSSRPWGSPSLQGEIQMACGSLGFQ